MSANRGQRIPDNYEKVDERIKKFREDYPGHKGQIITFDNKTEKAILWEARIYVWVDDAGNGHPGHVLIATGHAYDPWGVASQYEKTEKAAIGRALVMAGYAALGPSAEEMELHEARERQAAKPARNASQNAAQPTKSDGKPAKVSQDLTAPIEPATGLPDRKNHRPAYFAILKHCEDMIEKGKSLDEVRAFLNAKKDAMNDADKLETRRQVLRFEDMIARRDAEAEGDGGARVEDLPPDDEF